MRRRLKIGLLAFTALAVGWVSTARAQSDIRRINIQSFEPSTSPYGVLSTDPSATVGHLRMYFGLMLSYVNDPLRATLNGNTVYKYVHNQFMGDVTFAMGFWHYFELGLHLPVAFYQDQSGDVNNIGGVAPTLKTTSTGDLRFVPKVRFWKNTKHGFGLAFIPMFTVPTGLRKANATDGVFTFEPTLALDYRFKQGTIIALNLGYRIRKRVTIGNLRADDEFIYKLGLEVPVWKRRLSLLGEVFGAVGVTDSPLDADGGIDPEEAPLEFVGGIRYRFPFGLILTAGAGAGLTRGWGSPNFRVFLQVGYATQAKKTTPKPRPKPSDRDGDGILDKDDKCPDLAEDKDGTNDADGCPDPDDDKDGVCDDNPTIQSQLAKHKAVCVGADKCPKRPEDRDKFEDNDGCPDPDNDKDKICDNNADIQKDIGRYAAICTGSDVAPNNPEDRDGFQDNDGKPDPDNDKDGVCDANAVIQAKLNNYAAICKGADKCPNDAEDKDGFADNDGCPDPDNDGDGFCDNNPTIQKNLAKYAQVCKGLDKCPNKKEVINGYKDDDGCPDKGKPAIIVGRKKIMILQKVYFGYNRARILRRSFKLLRLVASTLKTHPYILKIRVEGHTDTRGRASLNMRLSRKRARSVMRFLVKAGVAAGRLVSQGFGETKPLKNCRRIRSRWRRKKCHNNNRRVEFTILKTRRVVQPPSGGASGGVTPAP